MYPVLLDLGFVKLRTYGACMALAFVVCWYLVCRLSRRKDLTDFLTLLMLGGVVGSRAAYVIEHWKSEFASDPLQILRLDQGGLMFYGGLVLSILIFFLWCAVKKEKPLELADLFATVIPLGHAIGRVGCFFYGCCYGRLSSSPLAVSFPRHSPAWYGQFHDGLIKSFASSSLPVLPVQLFEAALLLVLFAILLFVYLKWRRHTAAAYLAGYAAIRFATETLRGDPRAAFWGLSISQAISAGMVLVAAALYFYGRHTYNNR